MTHYSYIRAHGYGFQLKSEHALNGCDWCAAAKEEAIAHMRDTTLKTTKSIKTEPDDTTHAVKLVRLCKDLGSKTGAESMYGENTRGRFSSTLLGSSPLVTTVNFMEAEGKFGLNGTYVRQSTEPIDMSDDGLQKYNQIATANEKALLTEVLNLRIKLSRQRPVVLDLEEEEAATVLTLLELEAEEKTTDADEAYQNGNGYESQCAQSRANAERAEKLADRLRKILAKHLDKAYAGELGL